MATSHAQYYQSVRAALTKAMCIRNLPCQLVRAACCATTARKKTLGH
jgi:ARP2/3 complex 20 kDa subunit (ARPC4)